MLGLDRIDAVDQEVTCLARLLADDLVRVCYGSDDFRLGAGICERDGMRRTKPHLARASLPLRVRGRGIPENPAAIDAIAPAGDLQVKAAPVAIHSGLLRLLDLQARAAMDGKLSAAACVGKSRATPMSTGTA